MLGKGVGELSLALPKQKSMTYTGYGRVIKGVGGLFTVQLLCAGASKLPPNHQAQPLDGLTVSARGRGNLRKKGALLVGDFVRVLYDDTSFAFDEHGKIIPSPDGSGIVVEEILPISARLIANKAAHKFKGEAIERLRAALAERERKNV